MNVYYFHPLPLNYNSGQTLQVLQDYKYLSQHGYRIFLFGTYDDESALQKIQTDLQDLPISLHYRQGHTSLNRNLLKWKMTLQILADPHPKVIVARNVNKMCDIQFWKRFLRQSILVWERHEDAIPYLLEGTSAAKATICKAKMSKVLANIHGLLLTNHSQYPLFQQEFGSLPPHIILPNGVDISAFGHVRPPRDIQPYVITYTGQFTRWKNVELLFEALSFLDDRYRLRIAGGKGDDTSRAWIHNTANRFNVQGRVDYLGFVAPNELPSKVLSGSSVLLLPLGNNMESKYFTSPMKLFEYMATPIPVAAVDFPSIRGITGEKTVYLSPNDPRTFAKTILHAVNDPQRQDRITAMNILGKQYSHENRAKAYCNFLRDTIVQFYPFS